MVFDKKLLEIIACPNCKGKLDYQLELSELWCRGERLGFPVKDGIPVLLEPKARTLELEEVE
ncbi:Trm112 family protein [Catenovulum sp. 2E275]|uniref:Trm112 family protein n=1 Tax=Catenovulum sp. 2E275 TaxID=2980497 RepID=UPI0021CFE601|nr:Trm112 family protein [Catenovulum sp. 2E275]MCU4675665.1 Trm112 family protein [Catenovulum sp. 2E275]